MHLLLRFTNGLFAIKIFYVTSLCLIINFASYDAFITQKYL